MRRQRGLSYLVLTLAGVVLIGVVLGGCSVRKTAQQGLPIVVTDAGFRVTLTSIRGSNDLLILTFHVENEQEQSQTTPSVADLGGPVIASELRPIDITVNEQPDIDEGTALNREAIVAKEVEVTFRSPANRSRLVSIAFTQLWFVSSEGRGPLPVDGWWDFRFAPSWAVSESGSRRHVDAIGTAPPGSYGSLS